MNLSAIDLNLLVALDALLEERSVTRAARRVGLSQPAMSNALARLRVLFDDALLVRRSRSMQPTARATALRVPVREALALIEGAIQREPFDPRTAERTFRVACSDYVELAILPQLMARLRKRAPGIAIEIVSGKIESFAQTLGAGDADLGIGVSEESAAWLSSESLFRDRFRCIVRADHPRIRARMTRKQMSQERFIGVRPPGTLSWTLVDRIREQGVDWQPALTLPHRTVAAFVAADSDLVAMLSERLGKRLANVLPLRLLRPPIDLPEFEVRQFWHEGQTDDEAHRWFRGEVRAAGRARA